MCKGAEDENKKKWNDSTCRKNRCWGKNGLWKRRYCDCTGESVPVSYTHLPASVVAYITILLAEILNFQGAKPILGMGSFSQCIHKIASASLKIADS